MDETTGGLLRQVRDLAYRAEDTISLYSAIKDPSRMSSNFFKDGYSVHQIGSEIKKIKSQVESVSNVIESLGIKSFIQGQSSAPQPTYSYDSQDVVGREEEVEKLVSLLVGDGAKPVISLWGMGGIGKTTIARKVYSHTTTKGFFNSFAWVSISRKLDKKSVLEDVLKQLSPHENTSNLSLTELTHKLLQVQETTKCMLVMDDIWSVEDWGELQPAFGEKTKILLATRNHEVAKIGSATKVGLLSDDEGWELLKRKASKHNNFPDFQTEESRLVKMGNEMVAKCGNLPLAISLLGDILSEEESIKGWDLVYNNMRKAHPDIKGKIHRVLRLSYLDLPYYLKPCFLYMGMYNEGELITGFDLCLMWITLDMVSHVSHSKEVDLMDIAQDYLSELVSRSLVEIVHDDRHRGQTIRLCKLHKVVREMCLSVAVEEDFGMQVLDYKGEAFSHFWHDSLSSTKTRHLVVNFKREVQRENKKIIKCDKDNTKTIRSLLLFNVIAGRPMIEFPKCGLKKFKVLKSLHISGVKFKDGKLPKLISKLTVLQSLRLRHCNFDKLPSSVSNLLYLHTLDLWKCSNVQIPNNVLSRMPRLRHLVLPTYLPSYFDEKENSILILEGLEKLETLVGFNSLVHRLNSPTKMTKLRHFEGVFHDNQSLSEIIHSSCTSWKNLKCGGLQIKNGCSFSSKQEHVMIFNKLFNLHNLHMSVAIGNVFKELELESQVRISNLQSLILSESEIEEDPMEILGKLPILLDLSMIGGCFQGGEITCSESAFRSLQRLEIRDLPRLRQWNVEKGTMPVVYKMVIDKCPCLKMVPDGFEFLDALTDLQVCGIPALGERVSKEGEDFHKVRHVPSIVVRD